MKVLVAGFDAAKTEELSERLRAEGHQVVGLAGSAATRQLAAGIAPDLIITPEDEAGRRLRAELVPDAEPVAPTPAAPVAPTPAPAEEADVPVPVKEAVPAPAAPAVDEPDEPHPAIRSKLAQIRFADYHSILEVEPGATVYSVREQFQQLESRFSPTNWPEKLTPREVEMLLEVTRGLRDAYRILGDEQLRDRYERASARSRR